jgi:hypothetical protein
MLRHARRNIRPLRVVLLIVVALGLAVPGEAQREYESLFDKFNFKLEGSWIGLKTEIRLDSETLGQGATLNFEDDLNLDSGKAVPTLAFEWQIARKHRLGVRWQNITRDSSAQALTEIQWGDEIIPVSANITLAFDTNQTFIDYTYYPWVKERWAAGFGLGLRTLDIYAELKWEEQTIGEGGDNIDGTVPLPYIYFEYRRLFSERWRFITGFGWLYVKIGDIKGGQWLARASIEYLLGKRWSIGGGLNLSNIDVVWVQLEDQEGNPELTGNIDVELNDVSIYARIRF